MTATKMAACFLSPVDRDENQKISVGLEGKIDELLSKAHSGNVQETSKAICAAYTKAALLESRRKLFEIACKLNLEKEKGGAKQKDASESDKDECTQVDNPPKRDVGLVNRRAKPPVADDCVVLAVFIKNPKGVFPSHVLRRKEPEKSKQDQSEALSDDNSDREGEQGDNTSGENTTGKSGLQKRFERFVIKEGSTGSDESRGSEIAVTVTALCDSGTTTRDLVRVTSTATQTEESHRIDPSSSVSSHSISETVIDDDMSRKRTAKERDQVSDYERLVECERKLELLDKRWDREEKKMEIAEHEHAKEMSIIRAEQTIVKDELKTLKSKFSTQSGGEKTMKSKLNPPPQKRRITRSNPTPITIDEEDESWDVNESAMYVLTQDSQGDPVMTKACPAHSMLGEGDRSGVPRAGNRKNAPVANEPTNQHQDDDSCTRCDSIMANAISNRVNRQAGSSRRIDTSRKDLGTGNSLKGNYSDDPKDQVSSTDDEYDPESKKRKTDDVMVVNNNTKPGTSKGKSAESMLKKGYDPFTSGLKSGSGSDREQHSMIVTKNGWNKAGANNNKSPEKSRDKIASKLAGVYEDDTEEYFVNGLSVKNFRKHKELEDAVKYYCAERKVETMFQRVITLKNSKKTVGCKIIVRSNDVSKMFVRGFWPRGVTVREWYDKKPVDKDRFFESSDESEDSRPTL